VNLEGVICCVDYSDFLAESLPLNLRHFDRLIVVTAPEDVKTQQICDAHDTEVVLTDAFRSRWGEMHKAKGINAGLEHLRLDGWVLHLDADIVLPPRARVLMDRAGLDRSMLHGADRMTVQGYEAWRAHQAMPPLQADGYHVRLNSFPMMPRFNAWHLNGYAPPGYFQLWHPQVSGIRRYPDEHTEADRTDVLFAAQWERAKRALLPELAVFHLESEPSVQGTNWGGRKTRRWGPEPWYHPEPWHRWHRYPHHRHHEHHHEPYGPCGHHHDHGGDC
jgi:hypothetical protein